MNKSQRKYKLKKKSEGTFNRGDRAAQSKRYRSLKALAVKSHNLVYRMVKCGELVRPASCSICGIETDLIMAHHEDYNKPAEVVWVCWLCHNTLHARRW